jgi:hypothetical protein
MSWLSADQNGYMASSLPPMACGATEVSRRTKSRVLPLSSRAVNTIRVPSGEITAGPEAGTIVTNAMPSGGKIDERVTWTGRFASRT